MRGIGLVCVALMCGCEAISGLNGLTVGDASIDTAAVDGSMNDAGAVDAATKDTASGGDSGGFTVASVPGLVLWLDADATSSVTTDAGLRLSLWADQTTHHNDATVSITTREPSLNANAINSLPAIHFAAGASISTAGQMLTIQDNVDSSLQWGIGDFFVAIVGDYDNAVTFGQQVGVGCFFSKAVLTGQTFTGTVLVGNIPTGSLNPTVGLLFATSSSSADSLTTSNAYNNGVAHLFVFQRRSKAITMVVDGVSVASSISTVDVSNAGTVVHIGADGDANVARLDGNIGEIIAIKGALTTSTEGAIEGYLKTKWATP